MVLRRLLAAAIVSAAAVWASTAGAEILIGVAGPMTGKEAWYGAQFERGAAMAVADLNAKGGVLGQHVELIVGDDFCDPDQAAALAGKLASDGVVFVAGHLCSHSSIAASKIYEEAHPPSSPGPVSAGWRWNRSAARRAGRACRRSARRRRSAAP